MIFYPSERDKPFSAGFFKNFFYVFLLFSLREGNGAPPVPIPNYVPVVLVDNTGLNTPGSIYFVSHALDPCGLPCYLVPDEDGICQYVYPNASGSPSSASSSISKTLSQLPTATGIGTQIGPAYLIYIPVDASARGYISIDNPMYLQTAFNPAPTRQVLDVIDSSFTSIQDPNNYTWYQDFEFGLASVAKNLGTGSNLTNILYMNLSWVDYFCLPMKLETFRYDSNTAITGIATPVSGFDPTVSRDTLMGSMISRFQKQSVDAGTWENLPVYYYNNMYRPATSSTGNNPPLPLRILAAKNSISLGIPGNPTYILTTPSTQLNTFPSDYCSNAIYGPVSTPVSDQTTFMQSVLNFYSTSSNTLTCQIFPADPVPGATYLYNMSASGDDLVFTGVGSTPNLPQAPMITLVGSGPTVLTTEQLLSGSIWPFQNLTNVTPSITNELSKLVSALFSIGQLPLTAALTATPPADLSCGSVPSPVAPATQTFVNNNCGFARIASSSPGANSYFVNPFPMGPWYNLYDLALHELEFVPSPNTPPIVPNNPSLGLGYGYDYDDLLNMAGLINPVIQDAYGNSANYSTNTPPLPAENAYVVITLGNLQGTPVLNINNDQYTTNSVVKSSYQTIPYQVFVGPLSSDSTMKVTFTWFDGANSRSMPAPLAGIQILGANNPQEPQGQVVVDPSHPFTIEFAYNGQTYTYNINLLRQVVTPSSPENPYSAIDVGLISGITFTSPASGTGSGQIVINVSSVAPPWPG